MLNTEKGFTVGIYFPEGADPEVVQRVFDRVTKLVYGELTEDRGEWDPFIVGYAGDVLQIDMNGHECCPPHVYFSTSCFHGDHNYCQSETGLLGIKTPGCCKFCLAPCTCLCHAQMHGEKYNERSPVDG
jgi:hypothetical protein